jgi:cell division protein FtsB
MTMHWLFLLLALGCFALALKVPQMSLMLLALFGALVFLLAWVRGMYVARFGNLQRDISSVIDPTELRRLREQAQARRQLAEEDSDPL